MNTILYPTTNLQATEQLIVDRAEGVYIYDDQGNRYLEGLAGLWCTALGYGNQEVIAAASEQMQQLSFGHMFGGKSHEPGRQLAATLAEMVPVPNAKVFFGNSGSDANDTHVKLLRYYYKAIGKPEKRKIITRDRAYHGVTVAAGSLTSLPATRAHFDSPLDALGILQTDHPHYYRGRQNDETETEFVDRIVGNLERLINDEGADTIAAFIAEPITGASGVIVPPPGYYEKVQAVLNQNNILFIADEVITGFGRTGADFGCTTMNIQQPDMMTLAKQLSSAYFPISASIISGDIYDAIAELSNEVGVFGHGYTYSGHPVGCAVASKVLEIYQRENMFDTAADTGEYLQRRMREFADHPLVGEVRGKGLIVAAELVANKESGQAFEGGVVGNYAAQRCQDHGLIVRCVAGSSIALCPPLIFTKAHIDEAISTLAVVLDETLEFARKDNKLV
ncbi:MAG: aminotransferase [Pseudomonadales bacterium]